MSARPADRQDPPAASGRGAAALRIVRRWGRMTTGLLLGFGTALGEFGFLVIAGLAVVLTSNRPAALRRVEAGASRLAELERRRLAAYFHRENAALSTTEHTKQYTGRQALRYLAARSAVGVLGGFVLALLAYGIWAGFMMVSVWITNGFLFTDRGRINTATLATLLIPGIALLYIEIQGIAGVATLEHRTALRFLGPSATELLEHRVTELAASRAGIVDAVDTERRRIERDLHDGVQQRLVALAMLLGRARRNQAAGDPAKADELLRQAHEESQQALNDLREVAWRVYPTALDTLGLDEALAAVAERSPVPVRIQYELPARPVSAVETAAYFVVCEAVTNAAKHSGASHITVRLSQKANMIAVRIHDDGGGGADPAGGGLSGLARRVAALDGRFLVDSPPGGPTTLTAELPCG